MVTTREPFCGTQVWQNLISDATKIVTFSSTEAYKIYISEVNSKSQNEESNKHIFRSFFVKLLHFHDKLVGKLCGKE